MVKTRLIDIATRAALLFAVSLSSVSAAAQPDDDALQKYDLREFTCPIGGKKFEQDVGYSAFPLITMPDGSWLGDTQIGVQIPACPDNELILIPDLERKDADGSDKILYAEYTPDERAKLPALIADPVYLALKEEGRYAQAWWLATQLGRPAYDRFFMLQRSTWATSDPVKRKRLVARFASEGPAIIEAMPGGAVQNGFARLYIANALRELGRFDEASALIDVIERDARSAPEPEASEEDGRWEVIGAMEPLRLAVTQKDDGRFAAEMLPNRMVNPICNNELAYAYGPTSPATLAACKIRHDRENQESEDNDEAAREAARLAVNKAGLAAKCAAMKAAKQDRALELACAAEQDDKDQIDGNALVKNGPKLAADCEASRADQRKGALYYACGTYNQALGDALASLMLEDDAAFAIICPGDIEAEVPGRADFADSACSAAHSARNDRAEERLVADPAKLDPLCTTKTEDGYIAEQAGIDHGVLVGACSTLESNRETAENEKLATDVAAFSQTCDRYRKTNSSGNEVNLDWKSEQEKCRSAWRLRENTRTKTDAEAKGLHCFSNVIYSPKRPRCVTKAEYDREMAPSPDTAFPSVDLSWLDDDSSLMTEARTRAAAIIARAKAEKTYPKRRPGDAQ